jgi:hypothetical protein
MKLHISHCDHSVVVKFMEWGETFYFLDREIAPLQPWEQRLIRDCSRFILAESYRLLLFKPGDSLEDTWHRQLDGRFTTPSFLLFADVPRLFERLRTLRCKKVETTLDSARFRVPPHTTRLLTIVEMVNHANAKGAMARTLKHYRDRLREDQWPRLVETISRLLPQVKLYGQGDEFYFDGRYSGGFGMNGGVILHGDEFAVHT